MAIFRIRGYRANGEIDTVLVEAASEAVARNEGARHGIVNTTRVEVFDQAPDEDVVVRVPRPSYGPERPQSGDALRDRPVWTIAKGVFFGLLLWVLVLFLVGMALRLLGGALSVKIG